MGKQIKPCALDNKRHIGKEVPKIKTIKAKQAICIQSEGQAYTS